MLLYFYIMKESLSIIIPVYGEKELVTILYNRLIAVLKQIPVNYNIIYINDADPHGCEVELEKIVQIDEKVVVINFVRNFGEEFAVKAGIDYCNSDWAIVMDCDLQDKPEEIPLLYEKAKEGYDIVWGERVSRNDSLKKKVLSNIFYIIFNMISTVKIKKKIGSFSIISRKVIEKLKKNNSSTFNYIQSVKYLEFKEAYVPVEKAKRPLGRSGYNFIKEIKLALKILISCPSKILILVVCISFILSFLSFIFILFGLYNGINLGQDYYEIFLSVLFLVLFLLVIIFLNIGILGLHVFINIKGDISPFQYVIKNIIKKIE